MPGMVAMRFNPLVQDMAQRLKARGMAPKAIIAAAMHKLVHLIYGVLKSRNPFDVNWAKAAVETVAQPVQPPKNSVLALDCRR